ncbi:MAG: ATP-binding cassette domain-containing protein [Opitutales bacterium]
MRSLNLSCFLLLSHSIPDRNESRERVERALRATALWDEVNDRLRDSALRLSVGQQQRLCLARTLAMNPRRGCQP